MNKIIIIILTISFSINLYGGKYHLSIKGGGAYSGAKLKKDVQENEYFPNYDFKEIIHLNLGIDIDDNISLNLGIGWNDKGFNLLKVQDSSYINSVVIKNIELPIYLDYKVIKNTKIFFGGFLAIPTNIWYIVRGVNPINSGFILGLEYNLNSFLFDFRIEQGLGKIYSPSNLPGGGSSERYFYSTQIIFMVGYQFF